MNENTAEQEQRDILALLSEDESWTQKKSPKRIVVFDETFCNYCGKMRNTSLIRMQHGFSWYCLPCQLRYRLKVFIGKIRKGTK